MEGESRKRQCWGLSIPLLKAKRMYSQDLQTGIRQDLQGSIQL